MIIDHDVHVYGASRVGVCWQVAVALDPESRVTDEQLGNLYDTIKLDPLAGSRLKRSPIEVHCAVRIDHRKRDCGNQIAKSSIRLARAIPSGMPSRRCCV